MKIRDKNLTILILAGGKSERMGGEDKGLLQINNEYIINHLSSLAKKYTSNVYINANRNIDRYTNMGLTVWKDELDGYQGPLAGMYTGIIRSATEYILTFPCDGPFVSEIFFERMLIADNSFEIRSAHDGLRIQPVYSLLRKGLKDSLKSFIDSGQRKIDKWYNKCDLELVDFSDNKDLFININSPSDLIEYKKLIHENLKNYE